MAVPLLSSVWRSRLVGSLRLLGAHPRLGARHYQPEPSATGFTDYERERQQFRLEIPETFNYTTDVIDAWAAKEKAGELVKKTPAFWWVGTEGQEVKWSFSELSENSRRVTSVLCGHCGLQAGDRVFVMLPKVPQWWLVALAAWRAGIVLLPATMQLTSRDILHRLQKSRASCIIVGEAIADKVDAIIKDCPDVKTKVVVSKTNEHRRGWYNFDDLYNHSKMYIRSRNNKSSDPMTIFFTSGTTGTPKMTLHNHASYGAAHSITGKYWLDQCPDDVFWNQSDTGWAKAAWFVGPWIQGSCLFIHELPAFSPDLTLKILNDYPITTFCSAPTGYRMLALENLHQYHWKNLRHCVSAGEPLNSEVIETWREGTRQVIREGYGQTETVLTCGNFRCIPTKPGSMGRAAPGLDTTVVDANGDEVAPGVEGDIAVKVKPQRPAGLFVEYLEEPERTARCFRGDYYISGDRAVKDEEGYLWFVGRSDDVIISAGYRIGPFEVESALIEHQAVAESAVVSSPDDVRGEIVKAFVVLRADAADPERPEELVKELQDHVKTITAPYKYPRKIEFVKELPKTVSGKIRRVQLRDQEWAKK